MKFRNLIRIFCIIISIILLNLAVTGNVFAGSNPTVVMLDVQGNVHISAVKILGSISNTVIGAPLDPGRVQLDVKAIYEMGYFSDVQSLLSG